MNILVVEDEPALRNTTAAALVACGHRVVGAETGLDALARVGEQRPDLIVLDLHMPQMDGWEFLRHFRALPDCASTPVVVMSAAYAVSVEELDAQAFFSKPFDLDALIDRVEQLLGTVGLAVGEAMGAEG
jgi:CheY-like chemotaxis protein